MKAIHMAAACLLLAACSSAYKEQDEAPAYSKSIADVKAKEEDGKLSSNEGNGFISSSAAKVTKRDSLRKFVRTADMRFKAENVQRSTYVIEDIVNRFDGFVTLSNLHANVTYSTQVQVSADSSLSTTHFVTENTMSMRVPNTNLDTVLKLIARQIDFLDYRVITAEDVSLQLMANKWAQNRAERHHDRLETAINTKAKKLRETTEAEESLAGKEESADYNVLNNLSLMDQVSYSTISLQVYQRETVRHELIPNEKNIREYEPGLGSKMKDSLTAGWWFLEGFILFLMKLWPLIPIALVLYILLKRHYARK